ncbi:ABC transporter permease [Spirochaeta cellobiosiphila]|uniref:ABC transporter permease n=1 Tax=Spirochaeta cellobiosiphila TaxID=504483 RepID=UPI0003F7AC70|nr:ABC transporter permease [Spirochaeta cellobiosiphila]
MKEKNKNIEVPSAWQEFRYNFMKNPSGRIGLVIIIIFLLLAIFAPLFTPFDPLEQNIDLRKTVPFASKYILGTDDLGRDLLSRIIYGSRISMTIGVVSVLISLVVGGTIGLISGYFGGWIDRIVMRLIDIMLAFPYILLTIVIVALLGPNLVNAMIAIGISQIPSYARIARGAIIGEKENDYVQAERSLGASDWSLIFKSILPNCLAPISVQATLGIGDAILSSAALSFLGLGAQPPTPEWGLMVASSKEFVTNAWWIVTFPGFAILLAVLGFNLLGDGLRDVLDPRMRD